MFQPASVSLSGPAYSFLLYETCKASVRQEGFLLGEIIHKETISITDNEQKQVDISKIIKINSVIPCPSGCFPKGRVNKEKLRQFLGQNFSKVVAWYKYEPFSSFKFTLKDRALHRQFRDFFEIPADLFSVCFLSMEYTDNLSAYNYQQSFLRYSNGYFDKLFMSIPNLSEPNNTYKNSEPASAVFNQILSRTNIDIENTKGLVAVTEIENAVQEHISKTVVELAKAEKQLFDLENEISLLKIGSINSETARNCPKESTDVHVSLDEQSLSDIVSEKSEGSPERNIKTSPPKTRGRAKKKADVVINNEQTQKSDSNKTDEAISSSPELSRKSCAPSGQGRVRGKKKV